MPAVLKKKRGATPIRNDARQFPQLPALQFARRHKQVLAGLAVIACVAAGVILAPSDTIEPSPQGDTAVIASLLEAQAPPPRPHPTGKPGQNHEITTASIEPSPQPWREQLVKSGDNLSLIFKRAGYDDRDVHRIVTESAEGKSLARIFPGQAISFQASDSGDLAAVKHVRSALETVIYRDGEQGFASHVETRSPQVREAWGTAEITSSLFLAGQQAGLSQTMIMELANIFGGVIDFVQDPRKGDTIQLLYEELYLDGEKYREGDIMAASFTNQGTTYNAFRYQDSNGDVSYYNEEGVSMRKAFLLAPVDFTRISSSFNLRRLHPIYKTNRPHRGVDYAAPRGTPVFAAGDGRVARAGYSRANGNYVFIQHGEQYVTRYLHLHKRKVKQGQRVTQNQVIGTVGSTGAATGPHLHYEFLMNGVHRNPRTIHKKLPKAKSLPASEMPLFRQAIGEATLQLASLRANNQLAMHDSNTPETNAE